MKDRRGRARPERDSRPRGAGYATLLLLSAVVISAAAQTVGEVTDAGAESVRSARESQERVDDVVSETRQLETEYKRVTKQLDGLEIYTAYMQRQIERQAEELAQLDQSMTAISDIERQIVPLMIRMVDGLEQFIELDLPFLLEERRGRVAGLRTLMERADVSVAEKFRRVTEAFQIENDFGTTLETYTQTLVVAKSRIEAEILRVGRVGLYFQTNDMSLSGRWDPAVGDWVELDDRGDRHQIRQGIRMARKRLAPELLMLPIPAPEPADANQ